MAYTLRGDNTELIKYLKLSINEVITGHVVRYMKPTEAIKGGRALETYKAYIDGTNFEVHVNILRPCLGAEPERIEVAIAEIPEM